MKINWSPVSSVSSPTLRQNKILHRIFIWGIILILALPLFDRWPLLVPVSFAQATLFRIIINPLLFLFFAYIFLTKQWKSLIPRGNVIIPASLLIAWEGVLLLSTLFSLDSSISFWPTPSRGWGVLNDIFYIAFAFFLFLTIKQKDWRVVWNTVFCVGAIAALIAIFQHFSIFSGFFPLEPGRPSSTFGNTIFFSIFEATLLPFLTITLFGTKSVVPRIGYISAFFLILFGIWLSETRAVFFAISIGTVFFLFFFPSAKIPFKKIALAMATAILLVLTYIQIANPPSLIQQNKSITSVWKRISIAKSLETEPRFASWAFAMKAFTDRPLLGYGLYNSSIAFDRYFDSGNPRFTGRIEGWWDTFHNMYADILIGTGIGGLTLFIGFLTSLWVLLWRQRIQALQWAKEIHAVQTSLIVYAIALFFSFNSFATSLLFFLIVGYSLFLISLPTDNAHAKN